MLLKPEFVAFLRNNDIPSELTIREVNESLQIPLNELQEIDIEIRCLQELLEAMKIKRQNIQERIDDYNVILSPIRRLPLDVLHEIFFHCLPTHRNSIMKSSEAPVLLTRICSSWRAIALSSPRIWSKIHIPLPGDPGFDSTADETSLRNRHRRYTGVLQVRCDVVRRWLSRSGTYPLSISMYHPGSYPDMQNLELDELSHEMFNILLSFADRWSDVDICMPEEIYTKLQGDINPTMFPSLRSIKLNLHRDFYSNNIQSTPIQLLAAPGLCRINICASPTTFNMTGNLVQPIWNHLTHISLTSSTADRYLLVLLRKCPNLVFGSFMVTSRYSLDEPIMDEEDAHLPCLKSLTIIDSAPHETMTIIFNAIKAPALTRLSYQWFNRRRPNVNSTIRLPTPVITLLSNSTLISDLLLDGKISSQDTQECLRRGERVTHIVFGDPPPTNASGGAFYPRLLDSDAVQPDLFDLKILSIGSSVVTPLVPRLEYLEAYHLSSLSDEDLLDLITSRINAFKHGVTTSCLKSVKIHFRRQRQMDITEEVSRLAKEAGVEVKLELAYASKLPRFLDRLSPSFGLAVNDCMSSEII